MVSMDAFQAFDGELAPKNKETPNKKPDKFLEDLIEVQRTYRHLKEKWQRIMEEKNHVIQLASSTPPSTSSSPMSSEVQEIDIDVFEAPDKFQDISGDSEFDDEAFVDISATVPTTLQTTTKSQLDEIQMAIKDAFGVKEGPNAQMDGVVTTLKVDQTTPTTQGPNSTYGPIMLNAPRHVPTVVPDRPQNISIALETTVPPSPSIIQNQTQNESILEVPKTLLSTFGRPAPSAKVATPWRHTVEDVDPFEPTTTTTVATSSTPLPLHILPTSSFHSSGVNPDALPATNLFRYPDHVQIPFFGAKSEESIVTTSSPMQPTTPEPFRSEEILNEPEDLEEVEASDDQDSEEDIEEITESEELSTTTARGIENNEDYVEETFSQESSVPESFGIGKAPNFEEEVFGSPPGTRAKAFGTGPSLSGPLEFESHSFGGSPPGSAHLEPPASGQAGLPLGQGLVGPLGSVGLGTGSSGPDTKSLETLDSAPSEALGSAPSFGSFGIGRSPPGFSQPLGPTLPPSPRPQKPSFPTLVDQVEEFFSDEDDTGASSALGSFASAEQLANVPVAQKITVLDEPTPKPTRLVHMPTSRTGIFGTKLQTINQKAYKPPMFPSALSSKTVTMMQLGNPYLERTTVQPIGPHGLAEPVKSADMELPAWNGIEKDNGIMNKARREYQKEFDQQIRDVRMIDEEINRISKMNDDGRSRSTQRCSQVYAHTLSLPQIQKMSHSLGLGDVANVIQKAADLTEHRENDIAQLELDLEEKRKLIAKVEILLSLAESRALLFDLLNEQKKIAEKMENHALDLLQKSNFRPHTPSPFSAASDISELSSAVQQVLNSKNSKKGWSMMKRKVHKKSNFEVIDPSDVVIRNKFIDFNGKTGHLQETAEIVEPVLTVPFVSASSLQNDQFGRQPLLKSVHRRPLPLAPPTMSPKIFGRPSQRAAHHLTASKPLAPPGASESDTVHELIDMLHEDIVKLPAEEEERVCRQVQCDFEKADLCNFESSHDETTRLKSRRQKRGSPQLTDDLLADPSTIADDLLPYTFRAWSIWAGRRADRTKQIDIGPLFSSRNHHFAAVFLEPQQAGILSLPLILSPISTKIRLRLFEGTRGIRLRICCDRYCPLETEPGLYRGHRSWLKKTVTCPPNTQTLSFECLNDGPDRGACGVDDVFVEANRCNQFFNGSDQN
uniref:Nsp1_C domain-containing protein n=1 Tax=Caenorhabditis tropicalis TaxID=1561998 RepID=A0A1I7ULV7_9PELO